jgi:uncharacterized protein DUF3800
VYLLFLDESGKPGDRSFAIGGVAVRADEWGRLRDLVHGAFERHDWPLDKEAKWHGIKTGEVPPAPADDLYGALHAAPITCFTVILRPLAGRQIEGFGRFFADEETTYATALMFVAERYQRFLAERDSFGAMILDSRRREVDDRVRRFFERLQEEGTPFTRLERIVDSLFLGPSHFSIGLQTADLVVACTLAGRFQLGDASRWYKELLPNFHRHPATGTVEGVGIKEFPSRSHGEDPAPDRLFDLHGGT